MSNLTETCTRCRCGEGVWVTAAAPGESLCDACHAPTLHQPDVAAIADYARRHANLARVAGRPGGRREWLDLLMLTGLISDSELLEIGAQERASR